MAPTAPAARDIQATSGRDNLTGVAAQSVPVTVTRSHPFPLPTPPNSLSPGLAPHGLRAQLLKANLEAAVPPFDLHSPDTAAHAVLGSPADDSAGPLTPVTLAKYHLPNILLNNGPLAIRHITGQLMDVPGFASIPPAKARRLVVGALEGRGSGGALGGPNGDVIFEKVGWGRWDARRRGQPPREAASHPGHDASSPHMSGIPIARGAPWNNERARVGEASSSRGDSPVFSHDDRGFYMHDDQADKMSLDGSESASCSEAPEDMPMDDPSDVTDEEDWAAIGAAGLRAASGSYSNSARWLSNFGSRFRSSGLVKVPQLSAIEYAAMAQGAPPPDAQEREAIEALLQLGSV
ncbi:unnamed protein product [Discula destructiva]